MPRRQRNHITSFARVVRAFAEAALVVVGFSSAILLIGAPVAASVQSLHAVLSWLVASDGEVSSLMEVLVSVSSVAGGVVMGVLFVKLLIGVLNWRREATQ